MSRPTVSVYKASVAEAKQEAVATLPLPGVFSAPLRPDVVNFVHTQIAKNRRQAYAVNAEYAGMNPAAVSWGTGRAVSRIPRTPGGGTAAGGQGAFGNMCRNGRMAHPTREWRRWHRKTSLGHRRYALSSAVAATAIPALVMARGHRVSQVPELPLVLKIEDAVSKTKDALKLLANFGLDEDVNKCKDSIHIRSGSGKARNRRYVMRRGPLVVVGKESKQANLDRAFNNISGVEFCDVNRLNLLQLAPGGHMGRLVVWTQDAFQALNGIFGAAPGEKAPLKTGFTLPRAAMTTPDVGRIINSDEVQKAARPAKEAVKALKKRNPLRNVKHLIKLNPYAEVAIRAEVRAAEARAAGKAKKRAAPVEGKPTTKKQRRDFVKKLLEQ